MVDMNLLHHLICYQIYPRSFMDTNHDGVGDINGVIEKLDYLKYIGINAIWLSPVYQSPMVDNGYDISDYEAIAEEYGTIEDMKRLIAESHQRGMRIIMDLVINHTSTMHRWFQESKQDKLNPKRDWYIWRDPIQGKFPPNNWRSIFGGSAWEYEPETNQYYLHVFSKDQPDLNWENLEVRHAIYEMINRWIHLGVDGFRLDAITFLKKGDLSRDLPSQSDDGLASVTNACLNQPGLLAMLHDLKQNTFSRKNIFTVAEAPGVSHHDLPSYVGRNGVFDMIFEFDHVNMDLAEEGKWYPPNEWNLSDLKNIISKSQKMAIELGNSALFLENHDLSRSVNKFFKGRYHGPLTAKLLATLLLTLYGTPFIYQGQEIGMTNISLPSIDSYDDIATIDQYHNAIKDGYTSEEALQLVRRFSRDNARTPMQWNAKQYAGFSDHPPWISVNPNYQLINVEDQLADHQSVLHYYRQLIHLRGTNDVWLKGNYELILEDNPSIYAFTRTLNDKMMIVILNFTHHDVNCCIPEAVPFDGAKLLITSYSEAKNSQHRSLGLSPYEARVYEVSKISKNTKWGNRIDSSEQDYVDHLCR